MLKRLQYKLRRKLKQAICFLYVVIYIFSGPGQIYALAQEDIIYDGTNEYEIKQEENITEEQMDALLEDLQEPFTENLKEPVQFIETESIESEIETNTDDQMTDAESDLNTGLFQSLMEFFTMDELSVSPNDLRFQIYPISKFSFGTSEITQLLFSGNIIEDKRTLKELTYHVESNQENVLSGSITKLETYQYPSSLAFGNNQYQSTSNNWQNSTLIQNLECNKMYSVSVNIVYQESVLVEEPENPETPEDPENPEIPEDPENSEVPEDPKEPVYEIVETTEKFKTENFSLYKVKEKDTLLTISSYYGVPITTIRKDNFIMSPNPIAGSVIFLRNPNVDVSKPLSEDLSKEELDTLSMLGERKGTEYAKTGENSTGFINLATGNLMYSISDLELTEYDGISLAKTYNSKDIFRQGYFGNKMSSLLDVSLTPSLDHSILLRLQDGSIIQFHCVNELEEKFESSRIGYQLEKTGNGFRVTTPDLSYYSFLKTGKLSAFGNKKYEQASLQYDSNGKLLSLQTRGSRQIKFELDEFERITKIIKPDNTEILYTYNEKGFLSEIKNERGYVTVYNYDSNGFLTGITNPLDICILNIGFDQEGRVKSIQTGEGEVSKLYYDASVTTFVDAKDNQTKYVCNSLFQNIRVEYPDGTFITRNLNENGQIVEETDKAGKKNQYIYNGNYLLEKIILPGNLSLAYQYDAKQNLVLETNEVGAKTSYVYDANSNNIKIIYPDQTSRTKDYDAYGRLIKETDQNGESTVYEYTGTSSEVSKITDPKGNTTVKTYDACGRNITILNGNKLTQYLYSPTGMLTSVINPEGVREDYSYDAADKSVGVKDPNGNTVGMKYDKNGRIIEVISGDGSTVSYTYDVNGNLISETNEKGEKTSYQHNENDEIIAETKPDGFSVGYERDSLGRITKETDSDGDTITYEYHPTLDLIIKQKDKLGRNTTFEYDAVGNLLKETRPGNIVITYTYDNQNQVLTALDSKGILTSYEYDNNGNITKETQSRGLIQKVILREYDKNNNLVKETDPLGNSTTFVYDSENRLSIVKDTRGYETTYLYDGLGQVLEEKDRNGFKKTYTYDQAGNVKTLTDGNGFVVTYEYDAQNRVIKEIKNDGSVFGAVYDEAGFLVKKIDPFGNVASFEYDSNGNVTKKTDEEGNITTYEYDSQNNLLVTTYPSGAKLKNSYNKLGWITKVTQPNGYELNYKYNVKGDVIEIASSDGAKETYSYDQYSNLLQTSNFLGQIATYEYDDFHRLVKTKDTKNQTMEYTYDLADHILSQRDLKGRITRYTFDNGGYVSQVENPDGTKISYENNGSGNPVKIVDQLGQITTMEYDANNNVVKISTPDGASTSQVYDHNNQIIKSTDKAGFSTIYEYDANGRLLKQTTPEGAFALFEYDKTGRKIAETDALGRTTTYEYDKMGNIVKITSPNASVIQYEFNLNNQVVSETKPNKSKTTYDYDSKGNLSKITFANGSFETSEYSQMGRMVSKQNTYGIKTTFEYDEAGNVIRETESGETIESRVAEYQYDELNRLIKEIYPTGSSVTYEYNNRDLLIRKSTSDGAVDTYAYNSLKLLKEQTDSAGRTIRYQYDSNQNIIEKVDQKNITTYSYDLNGNLIKETFPDGTYVTSTYNKNNQLVQETDAKGNTTSYEYDNAGQLSKITDRLGQESTYLYDLMGNVIAVKAVDNSDIQYSYNEMNLLEKVVEADGRTGKYEYDEMGNLIKSITTEKEVISSLVESTPKRVTTYEYNKTGQLLKLGNGVKDTEVYTYNQEGQMLSKKTASGKTTTYEYDSHGNVKHIYYDGNLQITNEYSKENRLVKRQDLLGTTTYAYDAFGRISQVDHGEEEKIQYQYDVFGNLQQLTYQDGTRVQYRYNNRNLMTEMIARNQDKITYEYDVNGNLKVQKNADGSTTNYRYDVLDRITETQNLNVNGDIISKYQYLFDGASRIIGETILDKNGIATKTYSYDINGRLLSYTELSSAGLKTETTYAYDSFGNKTSEIILEDNETKTVHEFRYNQLDQLVEKKTNGNLAMEYEYDQDGSLVKQVEPGKVTTYSYTTDNLLESTSVNGVVQNTIVYDGSRLKGFELLRKEYSAKETETEEISEEFIKQNSQILTEWESYYEIEATPDFDVQVDTVEETKEVKNGVIYNKTAERVAKSVGSIAPPLTKTWQEFAKNFYEDIVEFFTTSESNTSLEVSFEAEATEVKEQITRVIESSEVYYGTSEVEHEKDIKVVYYEPTRYVYDETLQHPEVLTEQTSKEGPLRDVYEYGVNGRYSKNGDFHYVYDGRGSVSEVVDKDVVVSTYRYDPYGNILQGVLGQDRIYAYNGQQYTPQTGLQYLRARHYDSSTGTFTSKDTYLGNLKQLVTQNRYTYGNNNPLSYQDPSGHAGLFSKIVSAAKAAVTKVAKTVTAVAKTVTKAVVTTVQKVTAAVQTVVSKVQTVAKTAVNIAVNVGKQVVKQVAKQVVTKAKAVVSTTSQVLTQLKENVSQFVSTTAQTISSGVQYVASVAQETYQTVTQQIIPTVSRYITDKVKSVATKVEQDWEATKDALETGLKACIQAKNTVSEVVQRAGQWWQESDLNQALTEKAETISAAFQNSAIGRGLAAINQTVEKATEQIANKWNDSAVGKFVNKAANNIGEFYEKHKTVINLVVGAVVIGLCVVTTVVTAGGTSCLLASMASQAAKYAIKEAAIGFIAGGFTAAMNHVEEHGTLDGSGAEILETASTGFAAGSITGLFSGLFSGFTNPTKCFVAGTLIATTLGVVSIEQIQPGMTVYAMDEESGTIVSNQVVQTFERETQEVIQVTIGEETYTTTSEHPFYVKGEGYIHAIELERGDEVLLLGEAYASVEEAEETAETAETSETLASDKNQSKDQENETQDAEQTEEKEQQEQSHTTKYVEQIQVIKLEEPVLVYNFEVAENHNYFIGEQQVLVHNACGKDLDGGGSGSQTSALTVYDPQFAAKQMIDGGSVSESTLRTMIPDGTPNIFKSSDTITDGYKYNYKVNGTKMEVKWHSADLNAATKFSGSNSGNGWTAQIKVGNKLLGLDGAFYRKPNNLTHIPLIGGGE